MATMIQDVPEVRADFDEAIERLAGRSEAWLGLSVGSRVAYLEAISQATLAVSKDQVRAALEAKGIEPGSPREAEEWLGGPVCQLRILRLLHESLVSIRDHGSVRIPDGAVRTRPDGQVVVKVFPGSTMDRILHTGFRAEVWMQPGVTRENLAENMGALYRDPPREGKVALVLGAGNVSSIGPMDAVHKLFVEGQTVLLKVNPVNAYLKPFIESAFASLIDDGFMAVVEGGIDEGAYLCRHAGIDEIHITGSARTHDAIVFGTGEEGARRKAANQPVLTKRITSELGNVSPVILVPGRWSKRALRYHAQNIATQMTQNGGFNCNAAKVLVLHEGWKQKDRFLDELRAVLRSLPVRKAYYPGAEDRHRRFVEAYPTAERLGDPPPGALPPTLICDVSPDDPDQLLFTMESFCTVSGQVSLGGADAGEFLHRAVDFCNDRLRGTLNASIIVDRSTQRGLGSRLEDELARLRYGAVALNHWPAISFILGTTTWGAYPGHTIDDIQSGIGVVHNTLLFDHPEKSVVYGPFVSWPPPPWFSSHRRAHEIASRLASMEHAPSLLKVPALLMRAVRP